MRNVCSHHSPTSNVHDNCQFDQIDRRQSRSHKQAHPNHSYQKQIKSVNIILILVFQCQSVVNWLKKLKEAWTSIKKFNIFHKMYINSSFCKYLYKFYFETNFLLVLEMILDILWSHTFCSPSCTLYNYLDYWLGARYFQPLWNPDILENLIPDPKTSKDLESGEIEPGKSLQPK